MLTQDVVRAKLNEKCEMVKLTYLEKKTQIPKEMLSRFKNGKRDLWQESLEKLNAILDILP